MQKTGIEGFEVRLAERRDAALILDFIKALARFEKLEDQVTATVEGIEQSVFARGEAEVIIGEYEGVPVAFALFFKNYSTFLGQANMYLEDLFVKEQFRGKGFGKAMLKQLCAIAVSRGYGRLDWWCLDWNKSSVDFYKRMGARPMDEWTVFRLEGQSLKDALDK